MPSTPDGARSGGAAPRPAAAGRRVDVLADRQAARAGDVARRARRPGRRGRGSARACARVEDDVRGVGGVVGRRDPVGRPRPRGERARAPVTARRSRAGRPRPRGRRRAARRRGRSRAASTRAARRSRRPRRRRRRPCRRRRCRAAPMRAGERLGRRAAGGGRRPAWRAGEARVEVDEDRPGRWPRVVGVAAGAAVEVPADVREHHARRGARGPRRRRRPVRSSAPHGLSRRRG